MKLNLTNGINIIMIFLKKVCTVLLLCLVLLNFSGCGKVNKPIVTTAASSQGAISNASKQADLSSWLGNYRYVESSPPSGSRLGHTVLYSAKIYKENGRFYARVIMFGWQAALKAKATVVGNDKSIRVLICKSSPKQTFPLVFKTGDLLFILTKNNNKLYTTWAGLEPTIKQDHKEGQYFEYFHGKDTTDLNW